MRAADIRANLAAVLAEHRPAKLVQVGGHEGEEIRYFKAAGITDITVVEPIPHLAAKIRAEHPDVTVVECACSDRAGTATLHIPARTNMASLLPLDGDPLVVSTRRLDEVCPDADAAVVDVQGAEFEVLAAAPWATLRLVVVETLHGVDDPALSPPHGRMVRYMADRGFRETARYVRDYDWIQKWAYGRTTATGAEVRDVVFVREPA